MKIGLLTQEYHIGENRFGGVGRAFGKMAHWLADHGHEVTVYMQARRAETIEEKPNLRLVTVTPKPCLHWRLRPWVARLPSFWGGLLWHWEINAALSDRIMDDYHNGRIEVLLANRGVTAPGLMIRRRLPTVVRVQHSMPRALKVEHQRVKLADCILHFRERRAIRRADVAYCPSALVAGYVGRETKRSISVIRTPMFATVEARAWPDVAEKFHLPDRYMVYWGSILFCKGVDLIAESLPRFFEQVPDMAFVLVGDYKYDNEYHRRLRSALDELKHRYPRRLIHLPSLDHDQLNPVIERAHAAVLPSRFDNLPNTVLEAMHHECLVISTAGASVDEIVESGRSGLLIPPGDALALADTMVRAARMQDHERAEFRRQARRDVRQLCNPDTVMNGIVDLCEQARHLHAPDR